MQGKHDACCPIPNVHVQPEIVKFREMLDSRVLNQDQSLISIPEEHRPLIVKLAQERYAVDPVLL